MGFEMKCEDARREISGYVDGTLSAARRRQMDHHLSGCPRCKAVLDGTRNLVSLVGDERAFELSPQVSSRLYSKLEKHLDAHHRHAGAARSIPVGISKDRVPLGSHLIYFWESDDDFERGVRFLYPGLGQEDEHCILFGHDEALQKALGVLNTKGFETDELIRKRALTVLPRRVSAQATLSDINDVVQAAVRAGARAVRFLGNLGMGRAPLPAGEDDVLELESKASALISQLPCVIVCMYDVRTLSGKLIHNGGLRAHQLAVCAEGVRENPYFDHPCEPARTPKVV